MKKTCSVSGTDAMLHIMIASYLVANLLQPCFSTELSSDPDDVHFFLFPDSSNPNISQEIIYNDTESLQNSSFNPNLTRTIFIVHGFRNNVSSAMPQMIKNAFLASGLEYNIIVVSWGALSTPLPAELTSALYALVVGNVPIVGRRLAEFIIFMTDQNAVEMENLYLVGHSLGCHVSGAAGMNIREWTDQQIPRITGLDPAGPLFYPPIQARNIDKTDSKFIDIIHTNMGILGDTTRDGHADFYPNGGEDQPDCLIEDLPPSLGVCSHRYAYALYSASITKLFPSCPCSPFDIRYPLGLCSTSCNNPVTLGFHCPSSADGEFYLVTTNPP